MAAAAVRPNISELPLPDLEADRGLIEQELRGVLSPPTTPVSACMEYAVLGRAQRLRPLLALRAGRMLGSHPSLTRRAAAAVEIVHCASLIVDDLPCMDNDPMRRNQPSAHVAYGESTALLAAFGLVALAARIVIEQDVEAAHWPGQRRFQIALLRTLDCASLIGGQVMDLELSGDRREKCRELLNELKTVPLFLLAIEAAAAYAPNGAPSLREFGRQYGVALQMTDDYLDGELSDFGVLDAQLSAAREGLAGFGDGACPLLELVEYLHVRAQNHRHR